MAAMQKFNQWFGVDQMKTTYNLLNKEQAFLIEALFKNSNYQHFELAFVKLFKSLCCSKHGNAITGVMDQVILCGAKSYFKNYSELNAVISEKEITSEMIDSILSQPITPDMALLILLICELDQLSAPAEEAVHVFIHSLLEFLQ